MNEHFDAFFKECDRLGVLKIYDIDDPVFSVSTYSSNQNLDYLIPAEKQNLLNGCIDFLNALKRCDLLIGSTPKICSLLEREGGKAAYVWRNLVDAESQRLACEVLSNNMQKNTSEIIIGYASGSRAHEADFRTISSVLCEILAKNDNIQLRILGYLELPEELKRFKKKIRQSGFGSFHQYMNDLSVIDINLVPLVRDEFNECKSAIRFNEAALFGIPTIASAVGDFKNIVVNGDNGFLAEDEEDWQNYLDKLIGNPALRKEVGAKANVFVSDNFFVGNCVIGNWFDRELLELIGNGN
jgi:glycosyltransferase involved in cell wall biosynthesis